MAEQKAAEKKVEQKAEKKKEAVTRLSSAKKRNLQSQKRRLRNRAYESKVHTATRTLEKAIGEKTAPEAIKAQLSNLFSLMDKGVKKGIYKVNKAARTKSRLMAKTSA